MPPWRLLVVLAALSAPTARAQAPLPAADASSAFAAAGFKRESGQWRQCGDPGTASYAPGAIESVRDLNGDGRSDAVITEGSAFCFGATGVGYAVVSKQADGRWKLIASGAGVPAFLDAKGADGWPDMEVGGPGFCFPVMRWNGRAYAVHRHEYEGKPCRP